MNHRNRACVDVGIITREEGLLLITEIDPAPSLHLTLAFSDLNSNYKQCVFLLFEQGGRI